MSECRQLFFIFGASRGLDTPAGPRFVSLAPKAFLTPAQTSPLQLPFHLHPLLTCCFDAPGEVSRRSQGRASCTAENCEFKAGNHLGIGFSLTELPPFSLCTAATTRRRWPRHRLYLCCWGGESPGVTPKVGKESFG